MSKLYIVRGELVLCSYSHCGVTRQFVLCDVATWFYGIITVFPSLFRSVRAHCWFAEVK